ncbi:hypothetical protein [Rhodococcus sp. 24CO]|uniref:hypothetical protein n=1 Tax=Rhodococcus sp. 24CO TaxID=3117460 RepID=UPI003D32CA54
MEDVDGYLPKGLKDNTAEPFVDAVRKATETATPVDAFSAPILTQGLPAVRDVHRT